MSTSVQRVAIVLLLFIASAIFLRKPHTDAAPPKEQSALSVMDSMAIGSNHSYPQMRLTVLCDAQNNNVVYLLAPRDGNGQSVSMWVSKEPETCKK
ncbi:MAG: hypothetical protein AAB916_01710 [Patescibacteria group bacterium]